MIRKVIFCSFIVGLNASIVLPVLAMERVMVIQLRKIKPADTALVKKLLLTNPRWNRTTS